MANPGNEGTQLAEGIYDYTVDDHPRAKEIWRMTQLLDGRIHMQSLLGSGQQAFFGIDLILNPRNVAEEMHIQVDERDGKHGAALAFAQDGVRGQIVGPAGPQSVALALQPGTLPLPESIAMRYLVGQAIDFTTEAEQPLALCLVPIIDEHYTSLQPVQVMARATVIGSESVDLLMATITATHVVIEWPDHPPQHGWFDEHHFPVQWYWLAHGSDGNSVAHEFNLSRYAWHVPA